MTVATAIWMAGLLSGLALGFPETAASESGPAVLPSWGGIFRVNIRVVVGCLLGVLSFSLAGIVTLFLNGMLTGIQWQAFVFRASNRELLKALAPHGIPEIAGFLIAGAAGLTGASLVMAILRSDYAHARRLLRMILALAAAATLLILVAAVVESYRLRSLL